MSEFTDEEIIAQMMALKQKDDLPRRIIGGAPLYAVHSPQRGYFAPGGKVWSNANRALAEAQAETCEREGAYGWVVAPLDGMRRGVGPSEVKRC